MIRPLTKNEFIDVATNGIMINLYDFYVEDYMENLVKFIEEATHDFYIADFDNDWCDIAKHGISVLRVRFEKNRVNFYLKESANNIEDKKHAGNAIKVVYMHSIAWEAINNDGQINQTLEPWPI